MAKALDKLTYVDQAEDVVKKLDKDRNGKILVTTNKIRNMLTLMTELYSMARKSENKLKLEVQSHVQYVRMRIVYEAGRDKYVKELCNKSDILEYLKGIDNSKERLLDVCHYMEALVAYHKYYTEEK